MRQMLCISDWYQKYNQMREEEEQETAEKAKLRPCTVY